MSATTTITGNLIDVYDWEFPRFLCVDGHHLREEILRDRSPKTWKDTGVAQVTGYGRVRLTIEWLGEEPVDA